MPTCEAIRYSTNGKGTEVKQVVHTHQTSYGAVGGESLVHLISILTFEYLLPVQWVPVLAPTHLLPLRPEHLFTLRRRMTNPPKSSFLCVNNSPIRYGFSCESKSYPVSV